MSWASSGSPKASPMPRTACLSPLGSVGTDIIVDPDRAATTSQTTTTTTPPTRGFGGGSFPGGGGGGAGGGGGGGGFFGRGVAGASSTADSSQAADLAQQQRLGDHRPCQARQGGTQFTHDFFVPGTLLTFPSVSHQRRRQDPGREHGRRRPVSQAPCTRAAPCPRSPTPSKTAARRSRTTVKPPTLTAAQTATERTCIQKIISRSSLQAPPAAAGPRPAASQQAAQPAPGTGSQLGISDLHRGFRRRTPPSRRA